MVRLIVGSLMVVVLLGTAKAQAQGITVTPTTDPNPNPAPPAGQKVVYATGTYTLRQGQTVWKVVTKWYKEVGLNLVFVAAADDQAPANGTYRAGSVNVAIKDANGNLLKYTVRAELYIQGNQSPIAYTLAEHYQP
jgi:hypothetical protein